MGRRGGGVECLSAPGLGGGGNPRLYGAACRAGELIAAGEIDAGTAEQVLYRAAELNGHVAKHGERATRATIASGTRGAS